MENENKKDILNISLIEEELNEMKNDKYMEKYSDILEIVIKEFEKSNQVEK